MIEYLKADWQGLADVQLATLNWVDWFNKKRVHNALGYVSPFEFEAMYYDKTLYTTNFTEPLSYQDSAFLKLPKFP